VGGSKKYATELIRKLPGYEKFSRPVLQRWRRNSRCAAGSGDDGGTATGAREAVVGKRGRKVNHRFEEDIMARLVVVGIDGSFKPAKGLTGPSRKLKTLSVIANCMHSYEVVRNAALDTQSSAQWKGDERVQKLQFSDHWVKAFIARFNFSYQVITKVSDCARCEQ
jgi:hypothetical protein